MTSIRAFASAFNGKFAPSEPRTVGLLWAMEKQLHRSNRAVSDQIRALRLDIGSEFGLVTRAITWVLGPVALWTSRREERRLAAGKTYEPKTIVEHRNWTPA